MIHLGDITKIDWYTVPPVDVVTGGSPCQDLSVAGKRAGLAGERSGLYMEQIRCVKELRQADVQRGRPGVMVRPRYMVWENVPGAFSSNKGKDFAAVLEEAVKVVEPKAPSIPVPEGGWPTSGCLTDGVAGRWSIAWRVHDAQFWGVPQRRRRISLVCDFGGKSAPEILFERKGLSGDFDSGGAPGQEAAAGAGGGAAEAIPIHDKATRYRGGGPTRHGDGAGNGLGVGRPGDPSPTLSTCDRHLVYDARENGDGQTVCTITGGHESRVTDYTALCIGNGQTNQSIDDKAGTLNCMHDQQAVMVSSIVRRLTPPECERLQGYPDGWTDIGEWTDSKGKRHKAADSPRYKALGNSIALPFWFWLLRRIAAMYERPATLGSLFDGIGGFPLCWERCNGKGAALWASEIEEFPMAVTRRHFGGAT